MSAILSVPAKKGPPAPLRSMVVDLPPQHKRHARGAGAGDNTGFREDIVFEVLAARIVVAACTGRREAQTSPALSSFASTTSDRPPLK